MVSRQVFDRSITPVVLLALLSAPARAGELLPAVPDFEIGSDVLSTSAPVLARLSGDKFVAAWHTDPAPGDTQFDVVARVFDASGTALTAETTIATTTWSEIEIAAVPPGNAFVVAWNDQPGGMNWRMFDAAAAPLGATVSVAGGESLRAVAAAADGRIALLSSAGAGYPQPGQTATIWLRHFSSGGTLTAGPIVVEDDTSLTSIDLEAQSLTIASDGNTVVDWSRDDGAKTGVLRRYSAAGSAVGSDIVFAGPETRNINSTVTADNAGHMFVAYDSIDGEPHLKRLSLDGTVEAELTLPDGVSFVRHLSVSPEGRAAVLIQGDGYPSQGWIQRYAADGTIDGAAVPFTDHLLHSEGATAASIDSAGSVLVAIHRSGYWPDYDQQSRVRRFCDTDDAACEICPAFDDSIDSDSDSIPDGCDPCTVLDDVQFASRARTSVKFWGTGGKASKNQMNLIQEFQLPPPLTFASIATAQDGMRLRVEEVNGIGYWDDTIPGGAYGGNGTRGWTVTPKKLTYMDETGSRIHGIGKISISDRSSRAPGAVRVRVFGFGDYYPYGIGANRTIMLLGGASASILGACGEAEFTPEDCETGRCKY